MITNLLYNKAYGALQGTFLHVSVLKIRIIAFNRLKK